MEDNGVLRSDLRPFLQPQGVAVIGASTHPQKLGYGVLKNLLHPEWGFPGPVYPVNPKAAEILGHRCYADIAHVPDPVDLAVILIPAPAVPQVLEACGRRGIKGAIIVSGGFQEVGSDGEQLQEKVVRVANDYGIKLMGPNGIGIIDTTIPLNTTFVRTMPLKGKIAFISQSGALCGAAIDWTLPRGIGFSRIYSVGNQADLVENDFLQVLRDDPHTDAVCMYVEEISDGIRFYQIAREMTSIKPILFLKGGRTDAGQKAAKSHTGALAGKVAAYQAACADAGVHWCTSLQEMLETAKALVDNSPLQGHRIAIVTNAGGPAAVAADVLAEHGLQLAQPSQTTQKKLRSFLPPAAQIHSVVDMLGGAGPTEYAATLRTVLTDETVDGILTIHVPQATVDPHRIVDAISHIWSKDTRKPLALAFPGHQSVASALLSANQAGITGFTFPEDGVRSLKHMAWRTKTLAIIREEPQRPADLAGMEKMSFPKAPVLTDWDLRPVLSGYGIPVVEAAVVETAEEAAEKASLIGFPVVIKVLSPELLHKSDIDGVVLNVRSSGDVLRIANRLLNLNHNTNQTNYPKQYPKLEIQKYIPQGIETFTGIKKDPKFGPLIIFGLGGIWVELLHKVTFAVAPLTKKRAYRMLEETNVLPLLRGARGFPPADEEALVEALIRLSWLAVDWTNIQEMDINPLFVLERGKGVAVVDAKAVLA